MDISQYQHQAQLTDQLPLAKGKEERSIMIPLLGLAGEAGSLLTEYKKFLRAGGAYKIFTERVSEELGDILWYLANIAAKFDLDLGEVASANLAKVEERWSPFKSGGKAGKQKLLDEDYPPHEQLPRQFEVVIREVKKAGSVKVVATSNGKPFGSALTDCSYHQDGYSFHDIFHLAYAAILGWSPVTRSNLGRKRRSRESVDEVEDGGRSTAIEEGVSALVFSYAKGLSFFEGNDSIDWGLIRTIQDMTAHLEVRSCPAGDWERAILGGFGVWRQFMQHRCGVVVADLRAQEISYRSLDGGQA